MRASQRDRLQVAIDLVTADDVEDRVEAIGHRGPALRRASSTAIAPTPGRRPASGTTPSFPCEHVTAIRAPMALAIWMLAVPTPDAPACTSAQRPRRQPALQHQRIPRGQEHLGNGRGIGEADCFRAPASTVAREWRSSRHRLHRLRSPSPRSPVFHIVTRSPIASTVPANSSPGISNAAGRGLGYMPIVCSRSARFSAVARTRTTTSSGPPCGSGMSSIVSDSGPP